MCAALAAPCAEGVSAQFGILSRRSHTSGEHGKESLRRVLVHEPAKCPGAVCGVGPKPGHIIEMKWCRYAPASAPPPSDWKFAATVGACAAVSPVCLRRLRVWSRSPDSVPTTASGTTGGGVISGLAADMTPVGVSVQFRLLSVPAAVCRP